MPERRISLSLWFHHHTWSADYANLSPELLTPEQRKAFDAVVMLYPQLIPPLIQSSTYTMPPTAPDPNSRRFFRVVRDWADSDGDTIPDRTESDIGTSQWLVDTDGDGLSDGYEISIGSDPLKQDTDGDGVPDGVEDANGTDLNNADSDADGIPDGEDTEPNQPVEPAKLAYAGRRLQYAFTHTSGGTGSGSGSGSGSTPDPGSGSGSETGGAGSLNYAKEWVTTGTHTESLTEAIAADEMTTKLAAQYPFDENPGDDPATHSADQPELLIVKGKFNPNVADSGSGGSGSGSGSESGTSGSPPIAGFLGGGSGGGSGGTDRSEEGDTHHNRVWLHRLDKSTVPYDESQTYLLFSTTTVGSAEPVTTIEPKTLTILAGEYTSGKLDMIPDFLSSSSSSSSTPVAVQIEQGLKGVDLDVDANMNGKIAAEDPSDERPYNFMGDGVFTPLEESPASVIVRINNNHDSGNALPDFSDAVITGGDYGKLTEFPPLANTFRGQLNFKGFQSPLIDYGVKFTEGKDCLRVFYLKSPTETPVFLYNNEEEVKFDFNNFEGGSKPNTIRQQKFIMEGVRAGRSKLVLSVIPKDGTPPVVADVVNVSVNVDRLPDPNKVDGIPLALSSNRHRVAWSKTLDVNEINNAIGGPISGSGTPAYPPPAIAYAEDQHLLAIRGTLKLQLPALPSPFNPKKLIPAATWDTHSNSPSKETTSYWVGLNSTREDEEREDEDKFWIQFGVLVGRGLELEESEPFEKQSASLYLECGAGNSTILKHRIITKPFEDSFRSLDEVLRKGINMDFILFKIEGAGDGARQWKLLLKSNLFKNGYESFNTGPPSVDKNPIGDATLERIFNEAQPKRLDMESEFSQSVTAVAGTSDSPFTLSELKGALRLKPLPGPRPSLYAAPEAFWAWLDTKAYDWEYLNTASGTSKLMLLTGGGGATNPEKLEKESATPGEVVTLPESWPWHIKTNPAGASSSSIEMWDDRKWMFPSGTGNKWTPGR